VIFLASSTPSESYSYTNYRLFSGDEAFITDPNAFNDIMNEQSVPRKRQVVEGRTHRL
jgi:hypothetical protein